MHEILTIQCGKSANFIGTHFWNQQKLESNGVVAELEYDVLFSTGSTPSHGQSFTPRVLIYDQASNYGSMRRINELFEEPNVAPASVILSPSEEAIEKHPYQVKLEEDGVGDISLLSNQSVRFWSDFNTQFYRPNSYLPIADSSYASQQNSYEMFDLGRQAYATRNGRQDIMDTDVRPFLEECDLLQGINILSCFNDSWSGFTSEYVAELSQELPKVTKFVYSATEAKSRSEHYSLSRALLAITDDIDLFVPFSSRDTASWYGSARLADWLDTFLLPTRTEHEALRMRDYISFLLPGHKLVGAKFAAQTVSSITGTVLREFRVQRERPIKLESTLTSGHLATTFYHPSSPSYTTSFPAELQVPEGTEVEATIEDTSRGAVKYLQRLYEQVSSVRSANRLAVDGELLSELRELEEPYTEDDDFFEED